MQIHIISIGKLSKDFQNIAMEYEKMIRWQLKSTEISYSKKLPPEQIKQFEAKEIAKYLRHDSYKIALEVTGKHYTSHEFAKIIENQQHSNKNIDLIIGGAFGLDQAILDLAHLKLSLSKMTLPHQMAKILLLEQIYRSQTILTNHPYHK